MTATLTVNGGQDTGTATCTGAKKVLGGGWSSNQTGINVPRIVVSTPNGTQTGWTVTAERVIAENGTITISAICALVD